MVLPLNALNRLNGVITVFNLFSASLVRGKTLMPPYLQLRRHGNKLRRHGNNTLLLQMRNAEAKS